MITIHFDGGCKANPGPDCSIGYHIDQDGERLVTAYGYELIDGATNNIAEHLSLHRALSMIRQLKLQDEILEIRGDSQMVIKQMSGEYKVRGDKPYVPYAEANLDLLDELESYFDEIQYHWVPRERNKVADLLTNIAYFRKDIGLEEGDTRSGAVYSGPLPVSYNQYGTLL